MASLSRKDRATLTKYLQMDGGYVLDFSNLTFSIFFEDFNIDIDDEKYSLGYTSSSKGNRMKGFWDTEDDATVGKVLLGLIEYYDEKRETGYGGYQGHSDDQRATCLRLGNELINGTYNPDAKLGARLILPVHKPKASQAQLERLVAPPTKSVTQSARQANPIPQVSTPDWMSKPQQATPQPLQSIQQPNQGWNQPTHQPVQQPTQQPPTAHKVFIVHGHDDVLRLEVDNFIRKIGMIPIVLMDQASGSSTIIEKIEKYGKADFAIVLYTPCDVGRHKNATELNGRARQNVVFEHGYFIARLGRDNVAAIVKQGVEIQNDIQGVVYIGAELDWQTRLLKEFHAAGLSFNASGLYT
ncbi:TIR domain-containing protein [Vibrio breoganii]